MPNWVTFDQETSSTLRAKLPQETIFQRPGNSMMEYLLEDRESAAVAVLPCAGTTQAAVAVFRWNKLPMPMDQPVVPAGSRAGGFLGLIDEPVFEDEAEEKKSWWKRFWD